MEELQKFYERRFPGVSFKVPTDQKFPLLLLDGKTVKECLTKAGEGFAQRIVKHYQNGENVYDAVMKAWDSGLDYQHRLISTHYLYRQRIAEVLFYKANPAIFKYVMFSAIMDGRTSKICRGLNGKIYDINNPAIPIPPLHPRCRSRLVPFNNLTIDR
jgi:SPP1 gp7 family putative phage head morphogenesis protein